MRPWTPLAEFHGLLDLMLHDEDDGQGLKFILDGVETHIQNIRGHGLFAAGTSTFVIALFFPLWYRGGATETPVFIIVAGNLAACFDWLPIKPDDKRAIIKDLPIDADKKTILTLSV